MANKDGMAYEIAGAKVNKGTGRRSIEAEMDRLGTPSIVWFLIKRHKFGILILTNVATIAIVVAQFLNQ